MKTSFFNSIRIRIIIAIIVLISIPFAILQLSNTVLIYGKLKNKTIYTTEALSRSIATNVTEFVSGAYNASELLATNNQVAQGSTEGKQILEEAVRDMSFFKLFYVQKIDGMQTIRSSGELANRSDRWWFRKMLNQPEGFVSEAYVSVNNNELISSIFLPMYTDGTFSGVFGADLSLESIQQATGQYWNDDIYYMVLDSKGSVLTSTDYQPGEYINYIECTKRTIILDENNNYILDDEGQISTTVEKLDLSQVMKKIIANALDEKTQSFQFSDDNKTIVCAYQPIELPGVSEPWSVIVFQTQTDNMTIVLLTLTFILLISLCIVITLRLIHRNVLDPVIKIQKDMNKIVDGSLDVRIDIPMQNEIGELASGINQMVTSLKNHQQRLDEDEKMAALGNLVAGVAHEINTPLGIGVTTSSYMQKINMECRKALVEGGFSKKELLEYMETMNDSLELLQFNLERGSRIIQGFKKIAVDQTTETLEEFDVKDYINSIIISLVHEYKNTGHTIDVICEESIVIYSYPGVFAQILTNLIINSLTHAFKEKEKGKMVINAYTKAKQFVLSYSDDGCGIQEDVMKKLFTPFFTTNKQAGGSGLGLSIVYNLVTKKLNGTIDVKSEYGKGITFTITIPL
ncbi:MAG: sensor histidine kinase [Herbinix sp.]|nr:sensor histidine kinase [Herbinix sp.]